MSKKKHRHKDKHKEEQVQDKHQCQSNYLQGFEGITNLIIVFIVVSLITKGLVE